MNNQKRLVSDKKKQKPFLFAFKTEFYHSKLGTWITLITLLIDTY
jgi:hypothetical protein